MGEVVMVNTNYECMLYDTSPERVEEGGRTFRQAMDDILHYIKVINDFFWEANHVGYCRQCGWRSSGEPSTGHHISSAEDLEVHPILFNACVYLLGVICEASRWFPTRVKKEINQERQEAGLDEISWNNMVNFRNRVFHAYWNVGVEYIWSVLKNDLQILQDTLDEIINPLKPRFRETWDRVYKDITHVRYRLSIPPAVWARMDDFIMQFGEAEGLSNKNRLVERAITEFLTRYET